MLPEPKAPSVKSHPKSTDTKWARMGYCLFPLLVFNFSFLILQCGLDVEDPTRPSPPVWVQKSLPEEWPERGIDAHESGGIMLEWEANTEEDILAYDIYRAAYYDTQDSLGDYELVNRLESESIACSEYVDGQVNQHVRYFYKLKAEDTSGNLSEHSDSLTYMVTSIITLSELRPNGLSIALGDQRRLSWKYIYVVETEDYCITLLTQNNQFLYRERFQPGNYVGSTEYWIFQMR